MAEGIGEKFQRDTKHHRGRLSGRGLDWSRRPAAFKSYPGSEVISLPIPAPVGTMSVDQALRARRSVRQFTADPLSLEDLSYLLWACTGIRDPGAEHPFRTAPSAGALYPIETYVVCNNVAGAETGLYHYGILQHSLETVRKGDVASPIAAGALDQDMCALAPAVLVWTAVFERSRWKYGQRAYRYVHLDAGHIAQNLALAAVARGLGSCQIAATYDDEVNMLLGVDGEEESVVYLSVVGRPSSRAMLR